MPDVGNGSPLDAHRFAPAAPEEEHVYGACCPGWHSTVSRDEAVDRWVEFMADRGIDRICSLVSGGQFDGADAGPYADPFGSDDVLHAPVADHHLADPETLRDEVFPFLEDAVANDERVVVHCLAGIGRTGHVLAAWLVHGREYDPVDAIETVERMGRSPAEAVDHGNARRGELHQLLSQFA